MTASTPEGTPVAGPQTPQPGATAPPAPLRRRPHPRPAVPPGDHPRPPGARRGRPPRRRRAGGAGRSTPSSAPGRRCAPRSWRRCARSRRRGTSWRLARSSRTTPCAPRSAPRRGFPGPRAPGLQRLLLPSRRAPRRRLRPAVRPAVRSQPAGFPQITQTPFDESRLDAVRQRGRSGARLESGLLTSGAPILRPLPLEEEEKETPDDDPDPALQSPQPLCYPAAARC